MESKYWTRKEHAKTNFEVIRTVASVVQMIATGVILAHIFGWI